MHMWGDGFDFATLYEAERYIHKFVRRYSLCYLISKEKYGTIRYEHLFPKYRFIGYDNIIYQLVHKQGKYILDKAVKRACKKYPKVAAEILEDYEIEYL